MIGFKVLAASTYPADTNAAPDSGDSRLLLRSLFTKTLTETATSKLLKVLELRGEYCTVSDDLSGIESSPYTLSTPSEADIAAACEMTLEGCASASNSKTNPVDIFDGLWR